MTCLRIAVARVQHYGASGGTRFLARDDFLCTDRDTRCGQLPLILNNNYGRGRYETKRVHRDCEHRMYLPAQSFSEKEPLLNLAVYAVPDVLLVCLPLVMLCPVVLCVRVPSHSQKRICLHCELYRISIFAVYPAMVQLVMRQLYLLVAFPNPNCSTLTWHQLRLLRIMRGVAFGLLSVFQLIPSI